MTEKDIRGYVAVLASAINLKREPTSAEIQMLASAGLKLLEGLLIDIHTIAGSLEEMLIMQQKRS